MKKFVMGVAAAALAVTGAVPAFAQSSGHKAQARGTQDIPHCTRNLGTIAIVEPDNQWWRELNLGSPEAILKIFVQQSGCFRLVNADVIDLYNRIPVGTKVIVRQKPQI